ncbi:FtsQ-type POTRA domain-containing protein [Agromyces sp. NPDC060279]|uniref:FtsQ-type POTRA domain-containing protein n=1 Tax=Agromyces sp. NPDC060279 TaxID=3347092 RepID=UPI003669DFB7
MKRPQGFDGPRAPRPGRDRPAPSEPRAPAPVSLRRGGVERIEPDAVTAPVPVVGGDPNATVPLGTAPLVAPPASNPVERGDADAPASEPERPSPAASAAAEARAARKALAAAERARRSYERREVRRFTAHTRRRRRAWLIGIGAAALFVGGVLAIAYSPAMALREVRVEGASRIPPEQIQAAFEGELGTPLPLIGSGEVNTALRAFPLIETYSTELVPPGTLIVRITERTPVGVVQGAEGLELVDAAGVVIDRPAERPEGQPLIEAGATNGAGFRAAAGVVRALPDDIRSQLVRVTAETADDVRLELSSGASVVWGSAEDSALKAVVLAGLMKNAAPDSVGLYDVSAPTSPVTD